MTDFSPRARTGARHQLTYTSRLIRFGLERKNKHMRINSSLRKVVSAIRLEPSRVQILTVEDLGMATVVSIGLRAGTDLPDGILDGITELRREAFHVSEDRFGWVWFMASDEDILHEFIGRLPNDRVQRLHATFSFDEDAVLSRVA